MKCSDEITEATKSWGGILAISLLLILVIFAAFTSSGKKGLKLTGNQTGISEDMQEQMLKNQQMKNLTVKDGQNVVIF